jgi:SnoaL-like domain
MDAPGAGAILAELGKGFEIAIMSHAAGRRAGTGGDDMAVKQPKRNSLERRLRAVEDRLAILDLIASHPPATDSASRDHAASYWSDDGIVDMGDGPKDYKAMMAILESPGFKEAQTQGICHFSGLPQIEIDGNKAVATSYLQILAADPKGEPFALSAHGSSKGYRVLRVSANRWELVRTRRGWRIKNRTWRGMDNPAARDLLRGTIAERKPKRRAA